MTRMWIEEKKKMYLVASGAIVMNLNELLGSINDV